MALTQAEADMQAVRNNERGWLKRAFTSDPGTLEQIQQRVANTLNSIEAPPEYDDPELDCLASLGFHIGFDNGKFEVEAKLFAIDVGVMLVEFAAMEVALGPLGGAKFLASAVSKGTKAMTAAVSRLKNIPIFIPGAAGGIGGAVRVGNLLKNLSRYHARRLERAMFKEADDLGKPLVKLATDETHHIVPPGRNLPDAEACRNILAKFGVDVDHAANGVFLPANLSSPNPGGAIVHKILGNNKKYYEKVRESLEKATSQAELLRRLERIGETLKNGTFFHAPL